MLAAIGAVRPVEDATGPGLVSYSRHFRRADGELPAMLGPTTQSYDTVSIVTVPGDDGTWSVGLLASAADRWMRRAADHDTWAAIVRRYPLAEGEPVTDVQVTAAAPDQVRRYLVDGRPVATGIVAIGDAAASTSPAFCRGASLAAMEATCLRDVLREVPCGDPVELSHRWHDRVGNVVYPYVTETLTAARHRHAEIEAQLAGQVYRTADPVWQLGQALGRAAAHDPDLLRVTMSVACLFDRAGDVFRRRDVLRRLEDVGDVPGLPGPTRRELEAAISGPGRLALAAAAG
jgi:2-polyprenyl-6-methoxyphenol hydroxylase-like FAD-dependent oxidoreductase